MGKEEMRIKIITLEVEVESLKKVIEDIRGRLDKRYLSDETMKPEMPTMSDDILREYLFGENKEGKK